MIFRPIAFSLLFIVLSFGHKQCIDTSGPKTTAMNYCIDYTGDTCCSSSIESNLILNAELLRIKGTACTDFLCKEFMKRIFCVQCDPWSAHLFNQEGQPNSANMSVIPYLCPTYCSTFYQTCRNTLMNWNGTSPWNSNYIYTNYPTETSFCSNFNVPDGIQTCYNGTKFVPTDAPTVPTSVESICIEYYAPNTLDQAGRIIGMASPNDGTDRLFFSHQNGTITIRKRSDGSRIGTFATIPNIILDGEAGLLNIIFHYNYGVTGRFFAMYSCSNCVDICTINMDCNGGTCSGGVCSGDHTVVLAEYSVMSNNLNVLNLSSRRVLLSYKKPFRNHNGGTLLFGPSNHLYVTIGDGGSGNDPYNMSQNRNYLMGKILRINVDQTPYAPGKQYVIPSDNPFIGERWPEIWAFGLRNPWRGSLDRENPSDFYVGDVGQDLKEEVDLIVKGGNYGWKYYDGTTQLYGTIIPTRINPILEYPHTWGGASIIGGYVYRGNKNPCIRGKYIYGDNTGPLWMAYKDTNGVYITNRTSTKCDPSNLGCIAPGNIFGFGEDEFGDIYILGGNAIVRTINASRCNQCYTVPVPTNNGSRINVMADAFVKGPPDNGVNYGRAQTIEVKFCGNCINLYRETFLKFNISQIPTNFISVKLEIGVRQTFTNPFPFAVEYVANNSWGEMSITWNNKPLSSTPSVNYQWVLGQTTMSIDVTSHVMQARSVGSSILSLKLQRDAGNTVDKLEMYSRETIYPPALVIS